MTKTVEKFNDSFVLSYKSLGQSGKSSQVDLFGDFTSRPKTSPKVMHHDYNGCYKRHGDMKIVVQIHILQDSTISSQSPTSVALVP